MLSSTLEGRCLIKILSAVIMFNLPLLCHVLSDNFINRWAFQEYAQFVFDSTNDPMSAHAGGSSFSPQQVKNGDVIFVRRLALDQFFTTMHPHIKQPYILITHIDDPSVPAPMLPYSPKGYMHYLKDNKIIAWFGINANIKRHPKFIPIPIGVWQLKLLNDNKKEVNQFFVKLRKEIVKDKLLYMNFSTWTNPERIYVKSLFAYRSFCTVAEPKGFNEYMEEMAHFKFTLSPPGNGIDCYRTWEALLVGCIPIVKSSYLNPVYKDLPIVIVNRWEEITEDFLNKKYKEITMRSYCLKKIYMEYWIQKIEHMRRLHQRRP